MPLDSDITDTRPSPGTQPARQPRAGNRAATVVLGVFVAFVVAVGALVTFIMWQNMPRRWDEGRLEASRAIGTSIVAQIRAFKAAQARWPGSLAELPGPIQPPACGLKRWEFHAESDWFVLKAPGAPLGYPSLNFDSREGRWLVDD